MTDDGGKTGKEADEKSAEAGVMPTIDFTTFIFSLATQALALLGETKLPGQEESAIDLHGAKQMIDIIEMLSEKTKGNLKEAETKMISNFLYDLRSRFVQVSQMEKAGKS